MGIYINNNGIIERKDGAPGPAGSIAYDNSESGLVSNNVQNAIDEVNERVIENISDNSSIELTVTAAHAHAVGTSFMLIGQLVKVISAIEVGDTITVGTNVEPTSVLDLLGDVNAALNGKQDKLTNPLTKSDVVNNLTSDLTNVPLSAAMGKSLNNIISNMGTAKTWIPHIYDFETFVRIPSTSYVAVYFQLGHLIIGYWHIRDCDLSGISIMLQIRNLPANTVWGGNIYIAGMSGSGAGLTIQAVEGSIYFRPNWNSSMVSNPSNVGICSGMFIGYKS